MTYRSGAGGVALLALWLAAGCAPLAAGQIQDRDEVVVIEQFVPADRWNVAIAVRSEAGELRHGLNRAIHRSLEHGAVARLLEADDVPFLAPNAVSRKPTHAQSSTPP